jgi:YfiH family protein
MASVQTPATHSPEVPLFLASAVLNHAGFRHGFSTRRGAADMGLLGPAVGFQPEGSYLVSQVHGAAVAIGEGPPEELKGQEADAIVGVRRGTAVAVRVADCVPILLADPSTGLVAAVHAGWRGVVSGVVGAAMRELEARGVRRATVLAAVGPHIGPCCFEVSAEVGETIATASSSAAVDRRIGEKAYVDLRAATHAQLEANGIEASRIDDVSGCTRCDALRFFSFRRDGTAAGRHVGVIVVGRESE